ncbi:MAG: hypothetical protein H6620_10805 [Halobacteriovoraceae bacterium]|nr:hypothetical protein [Halobacteriovoraceae bacterium]
MMEHITLSWSQIGAIIAALIGGMAWFHRLLKNDTKSLKADMKDLRTEFKEFRNESKSEFKEVRSEIKQVSDKLTAEIKQVSDRLSSFEKSVEHRLTKADNGDQLDALRAEMHEGFNNLRQHILIEKLDRIDHKLPNLTKEEEKK